MMAKSQIQTQCDAAQQVQIEGAARMYERIIKAGNPTKDDLIKRLALAQATLEIERKKCSTLEKLLPKVTLEIIKSNTTRKGGRNNPNNIRHAEVREWLINQYKIHGADSEFCAKSSGAPKVSKFVQKYADFQNGEIYKYFPKIKPQDKYDPETVSDWITDFKKRGKR